LLTRTRDRIRFVAGDFGLGRGARRGSIAAALCDPTSNEATSQKRRNPSGRGRFALGLRCSVGRVSPWIHSVPRASPQGKTALCKLYSILRSGEYARPPLPPLLRLELTSAAQR